MVTKYMHTIKGKPAYYAEGEQILYAYDCVKKLEDSLYKIKKQQKLTHKWRLEQGFPNDEDTYGYIRVKI